MFSLNHTNTFSRIEHVGTIPIHRQCIGNHLYLPFIVLFINKFTSPSAPAGLADTQSYVSFGTAYGIDTIDNYLTICSINPR